MWASYTRGSRKNVGNSSLSSQTLKKLIVKALNKNQSILLKNIVNNRKLTLYSLLKTVSKEEKIPLSTLKFNSKIFKDLGLVDYGNCEKVKLTMSGLLVLNVLGDVIV